MGAVWRAELVRTGKVKNRRVAEPEAETGMLRLWPFAPAPRQDSSRVGAIEPSLGAMMKAISDLKTTLEPKLDAVTADVSLLRVDLQKMTDKGHSGRPSRA
ncbi:hypothetical protein NDU88_008128 [Pleurodeles waltl]|uniref:Uncharacterized protein n=1 Tax=Pleurodeles waltl TaxID=8319 RepID=A0AAV7QTT4_PLEWA|nr:hypothetical protein NDU88_008126 [Pleurodeles waltl]KAJ1141800.1 hypothetical protein NDU88_008128 [Pleurodeles waltl]